MRNKTLKRSRIPGAYFIFGRHFQANVDVIVSQQFIGWIIALGKSIRITGPGPIVERMKLEIQRLADQYR